MVFFSNPADNSEFTHRLIGPTLTLTDAINHAIDVLENLETDKDYEAASILRAHEYNLSQAAPLWLNPQTGQLEERIGF